MKEGAKHAGDPRPITLLGTGVLLCFSLTTRVRGRGLDSDARSGGNYDVVIGSVPPCTQNESH
eukprot:4703505-Amphidinium_carterae.1